LSSVEERQGQRERRLAGLESGFCEFEKICEEVGLLWAEVGRLVASVFLPLTVFGRNSRRWRRARSLQLGRGRAVLEHAVRRRHFPIRGLSRSFRHFVESSIRNGGNCCIGELEMDSQQLHSMRSATVTGAL
jgi:hypothetical protein